MKRYEIAYKNGEGEMQYKECGGSYNPALKKAQKIAKTNDWVSLDEYTGDDREDCNNLMHSWYVSADGSARKAG